MTSTLLHRLQSARRLVVSALVCLVLSPNPLQAQGDPGLAPSTFRSTGRVPLGRDSADVIFVKDGVERTVRVASWSIERVTRGGGTALELKVPGDGYVTLIDEQSLGAIASRLGPSQTNAFETEFSGAAVRGWVVWGGQPRREIAETLSTIPFMGVAVEHMLGAFPLAEGFRTTVDLYSPWSGVGRDSLRVLGAESVEFRGASRRVWRVELARMNSSRPFVRTFLIDQETGRMLQRENLAPDGSRVIQRTR